MKKGQVAVNALVITLVIAVVGAAILWEVVLPTFDTTDRTNQSLGTVYNGTANTIPNQCLTTFTQAYDSTNSTVIPTTNYTVVNTWGAATWTLIDNAHNNTAVNLTYTYADCDAYLTGSSLARTLVQYIVPLVVIGILLLAGAFVYLRK